MFNIKTNTKWYIGVNDDRGRFVRMGEEEFTIEHKAEIACQEFNVELHTYAKLLGMEPPPVCVWHRADY